MKKWITGARLPTLPASIVPVLIGTAAAGMPFHFGRAALAAIVALAIQIGCNYANDYSDGIRGTDKNRTGPVRLVASGLATPAAVLRAAIIAFSIAAVAGIALSLQVDAWLIAVGFSAIAAAWFYTGGPKPYGYNGLGEVFVFIFFGVVAVAGTAYVQMDRLSWLGLAASVPAGLLACALLMVNNLRDIRTDTLAGKRTLAVTLGDARSRTAYLVTVLLPFCCAALIGIYRPFTLLIVVTLPLALIPLRAVRAGASGPALIKTLGQTGRLQLAFGIAFAVGLAIHL